MGGVKNTDCVTKRLVNPMVMEDACWNKNIKYNSVVRHI